MKFMMIAVVAFAAQFASAEQACFFANTKFSGPSFCLKAGESLPEMNVKDWPQGIVSMRIEGLVAVQLWSETKNQGLPTTLNVSSKDLRERLAKSPALSLSVTAVDGRVCFFSDEDYEGRSFCATAGRETADMVKTNWSGMISSVRIEGNISLQVWKAAGFQGDTVPLKESVPALAAFGLNDNILSMKTFEAEVK